MAWNFVNVCSQIPVDKANKKYVKKFQTINSSLQGIWLKKKKKFFLKSFAFNNPPVLSGISVNKQTQNSGQVQNIASKAQTWKFAIIQSPKQLISPSVRPILLSLMILDFSGFKA